MESKVPKANPMFPAIAKIKDKNVTWFAENPRYKNGIVK